MIIPREIRKLMNVIDEADFKVYLVGGCVRDTLLNLKPVDYDLATNAPLDSLLSILTPGYRVFQVGKQFSTLVVRLSGFSVEMSLLRQRSRIEESHDDSDSVQFVMNSDGDIYSDLMCRDFTINSMAYTSVGTLIDPYDGEEDLNNRILKSIKPELVLNEDPLRVIRALRFKLKYDLSMDGELEEKLRNIAKTHVNLSVERLRDEFFKILLLDQPSIAIREMIDYGLMAWYPFKNLICRMKGYDQQNPYHDKTLLEHTLTVLDQSPPIIEVRLAALFHDVGKPDVQTFEEIAHYYGHEKLSSEHTRKVLRALKCSNQLMDDVTMLIAAHMFSPSDIGEKGIKRLIRKVGGFHQMRWLLDLMEADILGTAYPERSVCMEPLRQFVDELEIAETVFKRSDLNISGKDLIQVGVTEGKQIGSCLGTVLELVMDGVLVNERDVLMDYVQQNMNDHMKK